MIIDLKILSQLQTLFKKLSSGSHLNRLEEPEIWVDLETHLQQYETLFSELGFALIFDLRGFAYFKNDSASSHTSKITRRLALFFLLLFEYQADNGLHLVQFQQWRVDNVLIDKLCQNYHAIFEAEDIASAANLKEILDSATRIGFAVFENGAFRLLPAVHRYLDLFEELAQANRSDEIAEESQ